MNRYYQPVRLLQGPGCAGELCQVLEDMELKLG